MAGALQYHTGAPDGLARPAARHSDQGRTVGMPRISAAYRRQDFVEAAVKVIAEHGAAGATTRRIAAEAGSPLATQNYEFHTKDDLFLAVFDSLLEQTMGPAPDEVRTLPLGELAAWQLRVGMQWLVRHPAYARAQAELFYWAMNNNRQLAVEPYKLSLRNALAILAEATGDRFERSLLERVARLNLVLVDGLLTAWFAFDDLERLQADIDAACAAVALYGAHLERQRAAPAAAPEPSQAAWIVIPQRRHEPPARLARSVRSRSHQRIREASGEPSTRANLKATVGCQGRAPTEKLS